MSLFATSLDAPAELTHHGATVADDRCRSGDTSLGAIAPVRFGLNAQTNQHILTVQLEDWFQVRAFQQLIDRKSWYRFETRLEHNAQTVLDLLDQHDAKATFFVLGWVAARLPNLLAEIAGRGHEIACSDFCHRSIKELSIEEFRSDVMHSRDAIESAIGQSVHGFRISEGWFSRHDQWALETLAELGFAYDASRLPRRLGFLEDNRLRGVHQVETAQGTIWEVPPSTTRVCGLNVPIAGGNWFRQLPRDFISGAIDDWKRHQASPFVLYFHAWELDFEQPRIGAASLLNRVRHYRNLERLREMLDELLSTHRFGTIAQTLGIESNQPTVRASNADSNGSAKWKSSICHGFEFEAGSLDAAASTSKPAPTLVANPTKATIVVPCFNEEDSLPYLARTLERVEFELAPQIQPTFLFVDDCSRDHTWDVMQEVFGGKSNCRFVRHEQNSGVSAAILTGIKHAETEVVCSMDCDCSYDPIELKHMIPLMTDGIDLVTASPYHPQGRVKNVPGWRLLLSKGLSQLYRWVLPQRLHTWTSCFRVYRKSVVEQLELHETGFLGTAELVAQLSLRGHRIVEHPATLEVRIFGESKMKTMRTIRGHLRLIGRFLKQRFLGLDPPR